MTLRSVAGAVAVCLLLVGCGDDDQSRPEPRADWSSHTDPSMGIGFQLPAEHETTTHQARLPDGTMTELVIHQHVDGETELIVSTLLVDPDDYSLDAAATGAAEAVRGEIVGVRPLDVAGFPGREAEISFERNGFPHVMLHRAALFDTGLVQMQTIGPRSDRDRLVALHDQMVSGVSAP